VSVTDFEPDGRSVFRVFVCAAGLFRGAELKRALNERTQSALRSVPGVADVRHEDREVWDLSGDPTKVISRTRRPMLSAQFFTSSGAGGTQCFPGGLRGEG